MFCRFISIFLSCLFILFFSFLLDVFFSLLFTCSSFFLFDFVYFFFFSFFLYLLLFLFISHVNLVLLRVFILHCIPFILVYLYESSMIFSLLIGKILVFMHFSLSFTFILFANPSARAGYDTRSSFKRSLTGLNSEFSFSLTSCLSKAEELSLSYYLPIARGRIIGFIPFPRVLMLYEMQSVSSRI